MIDWNIGYKAITTYAAKNDIASNEAVSLVSIAANTGILMRCVSTQLPPRVGGETYGNAKLKRRMSIVNLEKPEKIIHLL